MIDSLRQYEPRADLSSVLDQLQLAKGDYVLLTLHRAANVDERASFAEILSGLSEVARTLRVVFPAHPRTQKQIRELELEAFFGRRTNSGIEMIRPQSYLDFVCLMKNALLVVTDSGGVQEETTALGIPCVTVRDNTERPITVELGTNVLAGTRSQSIRQAIRRQLKARPRSKLPEMWDGMAAHRVVSILAEHFLPASAIPPQPATGQILENTR
jgi:UDP-N-acetylglucosamine 2-epimerase (non-hydrolysing)